MPQSAATRGSQVFFLRILRYARLTLLAGNMAYRHALKLSWIDMKNTRLNVLFYLVQGPVILRRLMSIFLCFSSIGNDLNRSMAVISNKAVLPILDSSRRTNLFFMVY